MTLEEIIAILKQFDPNVDIQGTSRDGPFTLTWFGETFTIDTVEELQAQVGELGTPPETTGGVQPRPSTEPIPETLPSGEQAPRSTPSRVGEPPQWWEAQDGAFPSDWDTALYGEYPAKLDKDGGIIGPDRVEADRRRKSIDADIERTTPVQEDIPLQEGQLEQIERGGYVYNYNPQTGDYDIPVAPVQEEPRSRTLDQMLIDAVEAGDLMEQERVINLMDRVEAIRNRPRPMNDQEIFEFLAPIAQNPQHFEELLRAFKQDMGQQAPLVSVGSQGKRFPTLSFGETIPSLTEVDERMRALTG
ncbi:MAG: hypothetical protein Q8P59_03040, partial [Dehalococcoidia bacterium]|nr:hypothetical protein [Dehalococcoidia bacterium]